MKFLDYYSKFDLLEKYRDANKRLILLDYDGTLIPFFSNPSDATPGKDLIELLKKLNNNKNEVWLVSGRSYQWFDEWFEDLHINIIAEHGACIKFEGKGWMKELILTTNWKVDVQGIIELHVRNCQNSFIEEKEYSIVWHYRNATHEQARVQAQELYTALNTYANNKKLQVFMGNKIVEIKYSGIDKGSAIKKLLERDYYDFVLGIGDDYTDEDMFKVLAEISSSFSIKVGNDASSARFNLYTPQMVISLLEAISYTS